MERTLVLVKPDAVQRGLIGKIITRFEEKGFQTAGLKFLWMDEKKAGRLYEPHFGKAFYEPLVNYMTSGPITAMVLEGEKVIEQVRNMMGATNPQNASPGSIRGDFATRIDHNIVHGSDSPESAQREIPIFFEKAELVDYTKDISKWI
ncbi:MAG: nucleoside-diphosphate kinase [Firmicutes bacterium]|nr:nucleoside-diphosphate kinase [Bacillota bacterium]